MSGIDSIDKMMHRPVEKNSLQCSQRSAFVAER